MGLHFNRNDKPACIGYYLCYRFIRFFNFNFNLIQRALVLEDYAPALGVAGFVSRKKGARSKGKEEKEGKK